MDLPSNQRTPSFILDESGWITNKFTEFNSEKELFTAAESKAEKSSFWSKVFYGALVVGVIGGIGYSLYNKSNSSQDQDKNTSDDAISDGNGTDNNPISANALQSIPTFGEIQADFSYSHENTAIEFEQTTQAENSDWLTDQLSIIPSWQLPTASALPQLLTMVGVCQMSPSGTTLPCYAASALSLLHSTASAEEAHPYSKRLGPEGNEFQVNSYTANDQTFPTVTGLQDGGFVTAWRSFGQDGSSYGLFAKRYAVDNSEVTTPTSGINGAVGNEFRVNSFNSTGQTDINAAGLMDGGYILSWTSGFSSLQEGGGNSIGIFAKRYAANNSEIPMPTSGTGGAVGNEFRVNTRITDSQTKSCFAGFKDGGFIGVWQSNDQALANSQDDIFFKRYAANGTELFMPGSGIGGALGNEVRANSYITDYQSNPRVAVLEDEGWVIVWESKNQVAVNVTSIVGKRYTAYGAEYAMPTSGIGGAIGNEFIIDAFIPNLQKFYPDVLATKDGGFATVWQSRYQDDAYTDGIFGKRFDVNGSETLLPTSGTRNAIGIEFPVNSYIGNFQRYPKGIPYKNGFVLTWEGLQQDGFGAGVIGKYFGINGTETPLPTSGILGAVGNEFIVNTHWSGYEGEPDIAQLLDGGFVIIWESSIQDQGSNSGIFAKRYSINGTELNPSAISPLTTGQTSVAGTTSVATTSSSTTASFATTSVAPTSSTGVANPTTGQPVNPTNNTTSGNTAPDESSNHPPTSNRPNITIIASAAAGGSIFIVFLVGGVICVKKYRQRTDVKLTDLELETKRSSSVPPDNKDSISKTASSLSSPSPNPRASAEPNGFKHNLKGFTKRPTVGQYELLTPIYKKEAEELLKEETMDILPLFNGASSYQFKLGKGSFGSLVLGRDRETGKFVAAKQVYGEKKIEASQYEAEILNALKNQPHIVQYLGSEETFDAELDAPLLIQIMTLASFGNGKGNGKVFTKKLHALNDPNLKPKFEVHFAKQFLTGLLVMHKNGFVHNDIKPENVLLDARGYIMLCDMGCALPIPAKDNFNLTRSNGDKAFFSPERVAFYRHIKSQDPNYQPGKAADEVQDSYDGAKSDAWAAGLSLLQVVTGRPHPFYDLRFNFKNAIADWNSPFFAEKLVDEVPELADPKADSIWAVIKGLLEVNPDKRLTIEAALNMPVFKQDEYWFDKTNSSQAREEMFMLLNAVETKTKKVQEQSMTTTASSATTTTKADHYESTHENYYQNSTYQNAYYQSAQTKKSQALTKDYYQTEDGALDVGKKSPKDKLPSFYQNDTGNTFFNKDNNNNYNNVRRSVRNVSDLSQHNLPTMTGSQFG